jgi:hypothetical protein
LGAIGGERSQPFVVIHFDSYSAKWDEVLFERDFQQGLQALVVPTVDLFDFSDTGRLAPLYSRCKRKLAIYEIKVVHRSRAAAVESAEQAGGRLTQAAPQQMAPVGADMFIAQVLMASIYLGVFADAF